MSLAPPNPALPLYRPDPQHGVPPPRLRLPDDDEQEPVLVRMLDYLRMWTGRRW